MPRFGRSVLIRTAACLSIALIGAVLATGFPYLPNNFTAYEIRWLQIGALGAASVTSLITAYVLRSSESLQDGRFIRHALCLFAVLVANHLLWVEPIWGFRHDYTLGVFAWLLIGGEDGFVILPNWLGLPLTAACSWWLHKLAHNALRNSGLRA